MEYIYGALLLHKLGMPINEEHLKKLIAATGAHVEETKVKALIASLKGVDIESELAKASTISTAPAASASTSEKKEEKKEEKPVESAAGLSALFG